MAVGQFFQGSFEQLLPITSVTNTNAPIFAGIASAVANANGSITVTWATATTNGAATPIRYEIYCLAGTQTATSLFVTANRVAIARSAQTSYDIYEDATEAIFTNQIYTFGIRAISAVSITDTNTVVMMATSAGILPLTSSVASYLIAIKTNTDTIPSIKSQTDKFSFDGSNYVNAHVKTNDDKTGYALTAGEHTNIANDVWNALLTSYVSAGSFGALMQSMNTNLTGVKSQTDKFSFDGSNYVNAHTKTNDDKTGYALTGTEETNIAAAVWNSVRATYTAAGSFGESNQGVLSAVRAGYLDNLQYLIQSTSTLAQNTDMQTLLGRMTSTRAGNLDNLDATISSRASQASVDNIQNNTSFVGVVPSSLELPDSGYTEYLFYTRLYNGDGIPTNADSNIMQVAISTPSGSIIVPATNMTNVGIGMYEYLYTVYASDPSRPLVVSFTYSVDSIAYDQPRTTVVEEYQSSLDILLSRLTAQRATNLDYLTSDVATIQTTATGIKAKTELISFDGSNNIYSNAQVISDKSGYSLTSAEHVAISNDVWDAAVSSHLISGSFGANINTSSSNVVAVKLQTDKFSFDGSGNVNSNAQVVSDKSGYALSSPGITAIVDAVWNEAISSHLNPGTMGLALYDSAYNPTALTPTDYQNIANYIWDENRTMHTNPGSFGESNQGVISTNRANNLDNLNASVSSLATQSTLANGIAAIELAIAGVSDQVVATAKPSDIASAVAPLATAAEVATVLGQVNTVIANQFTVVDVWGYATRTLTAPVDVTLDISALATSAQVDASQAAVINALTVWKAHLTCAIDPVTDILTIITWLTQNEQQILDPDQSSVIMVDAQNNTILTVGPDMMVEGNGQFSFTRPNASVVISRNQTYTCQVTIVRGLQTYMALVPITVF